MRQNMLIWGMIVAMLIGGAILSRNLYKMGDRMEVLESMAHEADVIKAEYDLHVPEISVSTNGQISIILEVKK